MSTDRAGNPDSGAGSIASGDGATAVTTVLDTRDGALFEVEQIVITYPAGSADTQVQFYDDPDGTADGNLGAAVLVVDLATNTNVTGEFVLSDPAMRDFDDDVLIESDGAQDSDIQVYVGGKSVTESMA